MRLFKISEIRLLAGTIIMSLFAVSCSKSDLSEAALDYQHVKVYDDTLACAENPNVHISAGVDRLYMSYGRGTSIVPIINQNFIPTNAQISGVVMATEKNGDLIWRNVLPFGLAIATPVELADGSCIVAGANLYGYNYNVPFEFIYLFRFDRNGNKLQFDSLTLPPQFNSKYIYALDILALSGNDILIYGTSVDQNVSTYRGFAIKYTAGAGIQWVKPLDFRNPVQQFDQTYLYNCIKTSDGGFMCLGNFNGPNQPGDPLYTKNIIMKLNSSCEVIWTKWFDYMFVPAGINYISPTNIIQLGDGGYAFCTNDLPDMNSSNFLNFNGFIYRLNAQGDSIGGQVIRGKEGSYCSGVVEDAGQNIVGLFNRYPDYIYYEMESYFSSFSSRLITFDNKLMSGSSSRLQGQRTDFLTSCCKVPGGKMAFFGLVRTSSHQYYSPGLIIKE